MPLLTATTLSVLYPFLIELSKKGLEKIVDTGSQKLTERSIDWIKSLFFKNNRPKKALRDLTEEPENIEKQNAVRSLIENAIEDNPEVEKYLTEIIQKFPKIENTITTSKNVITGNVNTAGGNFINGDSNQIS